MSDAAKMNDAANLLEREAAQAWNGGVPGHIGSAVGFLRARAATVSRQDAVAEELAQAMFDANNPNSPIRLDETSEDVRAKYHKGAQSLLADGWGKRA